MGCLACGGGAFEILSETPVEALASAWAKDRQVRGMGATEETAWRRSLREAIGTEKILFKRCEACGLSAAEPAACWKDGSYPDDEDYPLRWEFAEALEGLARGSRVLEVGCGEGKFLGEAKAHGLVPVGVDFSSGAVERACAAGITAFASNLSTLPALAADLGAPFDAAFCFHTIEHLPDPSVLLNAVRPLLKPGAAFFVSCPGPRRYTRLIEDQQVSGFDFWDFPPHHVLRWTLPALAQLFTRHGWRPFLQKEEPRGLVDAAAHVGVTRARYHGYLESPVRRRIAIAKARMELMLAPPSHRKGLSLLFGARVPHA
ncbi:MAG: class I SAM-dependent methyltransferase [Myxococcaceae bacterium]